MAAAALFFSPRNRARLLMGLPLATGVLGYAVPKYWQHPAASTVALLLMVFGFAVAGLDQARRTRGAGAAIVLLCAGIAQGIAVTTLIGRIFAAEDGAPPVWAFAMLGYLGGLSYFMAGFIVEVTRDGGWLQGLRRETWLLMVVIVALSAGVL